MNAASDILTFPGVATAATAGKARTKEYRAYIRMIHRCHNPQYEGYENYGARGIKVCKRWRASFENFLADMGPAPTKDHTLDREKNNQGYSPDNCRWATWKVQANNRRTNVTLTHNGMTKTMAEWADFLGDGCTRKRLWKRVKLGWPLEKVLSPWPAQQPQEERRAA